MKALIQLLVLGLWQLAVAFGAWGNEAPDSTNLAVNPGFEIFDPAGKPTGWLLPAEFVVTNESPRSGKACLRLKNGDPAKYLLARTALPLEPGRRYEFSAWVRTRDIQGADSGATICLEWSDANGQWIGGAYPAGKKGTTATWTQISGITGPMPTNAARFNLSCYLRRGNTGTAWWDDIEVREYRPALVECLVADCYRNQTAGGTVNIHAGLALADHGLAADQVSASLAIMDAQERAVRTFAPSEIRSDQVKFAFDATELSPSRYRLECVVRRKGEEAVLGRAAIPLRRLERLPPRKAWIDSHRRLILDGKPFFPLGTYWSSVNERDLDIYARSAFNCLMPYDAPDRRELDLAEARNLKVIYSVKDLYAGTKLAPASLKTPADERAALEAKVRLVGDHPAVMAWYINDELPLTLLETLTRHRDWMEELDPGRPTWVVLYQVDQVRSYLPTFDIIGTDPYPVPQSPPSRALDWTRKTVEATFERRAVWMVPQIFNWASYKNTPAEKKKYRAPTLEEMRSMAWQCIAGGANGLIFYSWFDLWRMDKEIAQGGRALEREPFEERWREVCQVAEEIKRFVPVLLAEESPHRPTTFAGPELVGWRAYARDGRTFLLVTNGKRKPSQVEFQFAQPIGAANTEFGEGDVKIIRAVLAMDLKPLEVRLIRLDFGGTP